MSEGNRRSAFSRGFYGALGVVAALLVITIVVWVVAATCAENLG